MLPDVLEQLVEPKFVLDKAKKYVAIIYRDADNADWKANPEAYTIEKKQVNSKTKLPIHLAKGGGCAIRFVRQ